MRLPDAEKTVTKMMRQFGLAHWTYATNSRKRTLGLCFSQQKRIELSINFIEHNPAAVVKETILHEIAHALVGSQHGHDSKWMAMAERIGCQPRRKNATAYMPPGPWQATCGGCERLFSKYRRPKYLSGQNCTICGPRLGRLRFKKVELDLPKGAAAMRR